MNQACYTSLPEIAALLSVSSLVISLFAVLNWPSVVLPLLGISATATGAMLGTIAVFIITLSLMLPPALLCFGSSAEPKSESVQQSLQEVKEAVVSPASQSNIQPPLPPGEKPKRGRPRKSGQ